MLSPCCSYAPWEKCNDEPPWPFFRIFTLKITLTSDFGRKAPIYPVLWTLTHDLPQRGPVVSPPSVPSRENAGDLYPAPQRSPRGRPSKGLLGREIAWGASSHPSRLNKRFAALTASPIRPLCPSNPGQRIPSTAGHYVIAETAKQTGGGVQSQ